MTINELRKDRTDRQRVMKRLDDLLHDIVVLKYPACVTCGSTSTPTTGHLITRGSLSVKHELLNVARQCFVCNAAHETNPKPFEDWFIRTYGQRALDDLKARANQDIKSIKTWQLESIEDTLKVIKKHLENEAREE